MMLSQVALKELRDEFELIPQAVIKKPVEDIAASLRIDFERGHDDFDFYQGIGMKLNRDLSFALMKYRGHPPDTFTIYLPNQIRDIDMITNVIASILGELKLSEMFILWQRRDGPNL